MEAVLFQRYLERQELMRFEEARGVLGGLCSPVGKDKAAGDVDMPDGPGAGARREEEATEKKKEENEEEEKLNEQSPQMHTPTIELTPTDYLLGLFDATGELMRFAITSIATSGALPSSSPALSSTTSPPTTTSTSTDTTSSPSAPTTTPRTSLTDLQALRTALTRFDYGSGPFARDASKKLEVTLQSVEKVERAMYGLVVRGSERPKGWVPDMSGGSMGGGDGDREAVEGY